MAQYGFDGLFFARLDYQDKNNRINTKTMEVVWETSPSLGKFFVINSAGSVNSRSYLARMWSIGHGMTSYYTNQSEGFKSRHWETLIHIPTRKLAEFTDLGFNDPFKHSAYLLGWLKSIFKYLIMIIVTKYADSMRASM